MLYAVIGLSFVVCHLIAFDIVYAIRLHRTNKNLETVAECLLTYMKQPESVEIVEYSKPASTGFNFPNTEGF